MGAPRVSDELLAMARPFRTYAALAARGEDAARRSLARRLALVLLALGAFVSLTTCRRLVAVHVLAGALAWAFAPALQLLALAVGVRLCAPGRALAPAFSLYLVGHGPWLALMALASGVCLFAPDVYAAFRALLAAWALQGAVALAFAWGAVLTAAFFRAGLGLSRGRTAAATAAFYGVYAGAIVGWYAVTHQLVPILPGTR